MEYDSDIVAVSCTTKLGVIVC